MHLFLEPADAPCLPAPVPTEGGAGTPVFLAPAGTRLPHHGKITENRNFLFDTAKMLRGQAGS